MRVTGFLHTVQPDVRKRIRHLLRIELLIAAATENLLHQEVIDDHAEEAAGGEQRVDVTKSAFLHAAADVSCQRLVVNGHKSPEEALRELVVLKRGEPEQAREFGVAQGPVQELAGDGGEDFQVAS